MQNFVTGLEVHIAMLKKITYLKISGKVQNDITDLHTKMKAQSPLRWFRDPPHIVIAYKQLK